MKFDYQVIEQNMSISNTTTPKDILIPYAVRIYDIHKFVGKVECRMR